MEHAVAVERPRWRRKRYVVPFALGLLAIVLIASAWAYYTSQATSQTRSGGNLGARSQCAPAVAEPGGGACTLWITTFDGSTLSPGTSSQVDFYVKQGENSPIRKFVLNPAQTIYTVVTGDPVNCPASNFTVSGIQWTGGFGTPAGSSVGNLASLPATGGSQTNGVNGKFMLNFTDNAGASQDGCAGQSISVTLSL